MGLLRKIVMVGVGKKLYDEARKPENQKRIKDVAESVKARQRGTRKRH